MIAPVTIKGRAPAKINLNLEIVGRRSDGYHLLNSLFLPLQWADELTLHISPASTPIVSCQVPERAELSGEGNLAHRAAVAYLRRGGLRGEIHIELKKNIWVAAGLGGGSSDAAITLKLLNQFYDALDTTDIQSLALELGADVPYFLDPHPANVTGIGEEISPIKGFPKLHIVLVNPGRPLSTAEVFRYNSAMPPKPGTTEPGMTERPTMSNVDSFWSNPGRWVHNDLEPAAFEMMKELHDIQEMLRDTGPAASGMTGSGPTLFGVYENDAKATQASRQLARNSELKVVVSETL
jgi:4-diphosphocytidyl-2-C-methyl-D-erythritol kinase